MNPKVVAELCGELTLLRFFPSDENARAAIVLLVGRMCSNEDQVRWLVQRVLSLCNDWPGPLVLRQILCSKFKPADRIEAGATASFPEGPPSERRIEASPMLSLPADREVTVDLDLDTAVRNLAKLKRLN